MTHAKTIGRRELLRGGGVAALAVAGAAVVPFGLDMRAEAGQAGDAELIRLGDECLKLAHEFRRLRRAFDGAARKAAVAFAATNAQRWCLEGYCGSGQMMRVSNAAGAVYQVYGVDAAPLWHAHCLGKEDPHPSSYEGKWCSMRRAERKRSAKLTSSTSSLTVSSSHLAPARQNPLIATSISRGGLRLTPLFAARSTSSPVFGQRRHKD